MWKRIVAALVAVVLAGIGIVLVLSYANSADERALSGLETRDVLVAVEDVPEGTSAEELGQRVQLRPVPQNFVVDGAIEDTDELSGEVLTAALAPGEQVQRARFSTPAAIRAAGEVELPEEAADLHQVTIALEKPRALGGNVTAGDTVGVFMSYDITGQDGYELTDDGQVLRRRTGVEDEEASDDGASGSISATHLTLHKVLVVRVEGGYVAPPSEAETDDEGQQAQNTINVTLALAAPEAEQLVFAMEFGSVWLSMEPESADEDGTGIVVVTIPDEARNVYQ